MPGSSIQCVLLQRLSSQLSSGNSLSKGCVISAIKWLLETRAVGLEGLGRNPFCFPGFHRPAEDVRMV